LKSFNSDLFGDPLPVLVVRVLKGSEDNGKGVTLLEFVEKNIGLILVVICRNEVLAFYL